MRTLPNIRSRAKVKAETAFSYDAAELAASLYDQGENARGLKVVRGLTYLRFIQAPV